MEIQKEITLIGTSSISSFDKGEKLFIDISIDKCEVLITSTKDGEKRFYKMDYANPPAGFVRFDPLDKKLVIEEWTIWRDDLDRKNKKSVVHYFENVELIKK